MDRKQMDREERQTMELFSERIDESTPCETKPAHSRKTATEKVTQAVAAAEKRMRAKSGKGK